MFLAIILFHPGYFTIHRKNRIIMLHYWCKLTIFVNYEKDKKCSI